MTNTSPSIPIIISVGGSLIVPDGINTSFLSAFKDTILAEIAKGKRFVVIAGGGKTARRYQQAAGDVTPLTHEDLDWLGIHATRLNAHLLRAIFVEVAHPVIVENPVKIETDAARAPEPVIVAAGWRPGASTDFVAAKIAEAIGAKKLVNLSNIEHVFDKDPKAYPDAAPIDTIDWAAFRKLLPKEWDPGLSSPFDPVAAELAERCSMEVAIMSGDDLTQLTRYLDDQPFEGTTIH